jgi:hypothetical protein
MRIMITLLVTATKSRSLAKTGSAAGVVHGTCHVTRIKK